MREEAQAPASLIGQRTTQYEHNCLVIGRKKEPAHQQFLFSFRDFRDSALVLDSKNAKHVFLSDVNVTVPEFKLRYKTLLSIFVPFDLMVGKPNSRRHLVDRHG